VLVVRAGDRADYGLFARLFPELRVADPVPTSEQFAEQMLPLVVIAQDGEAPAGYAFWRCHGRNAHVGHIVVAPEARGRGVAGALLDDVRKRVRAAGCTRWSLNVKQDNAAAIRVYERMGMTIEQEGWAVDTTWAELEALSRPPSAASEPALVPPSEDATIAARFGVDAARLGQQRQKPGEVLYACYASGTPVAFAAFDPSFPVVHPIHVVKTDMAHAMLSALRRHARHEHVHVTVERDVALYEALLAVGGRLRHAFFRMGAAI
jgi:GNAT superfamily N-acetyltransferase